MPAMCKKPWGFEKSILTAYRRKETEIARNRGFGLFFVARRFLSTTASTKNQTFGLSASDNVSTIPCIFCSSKHT